MVAQWSHTKGGRSERKTRIRNGARERGGGSLLILFSLVSFSYNIFFEKLLLSKGRQKHNSSHLKFYFFNLLFSVIFMKPSYVRSVGFYYRRAILYTKAVCRNCHGLMEIPAKQRRRRRGRRRRRQCHAGFSSLCVCGQFVRKFTKVVPAYNTQNIKFFKRQFKLFYKKVLLNGSLLFISS